EANEAIAVHHRLAAAVAEWARREGAPDALWSVRALVEVAGIPTEDLTAGEAEFVRASRRAIWRRRIVRGGAALAVPVIGLAVYVGAKVVARRDLDRKVSANLEAAAAQLGDARRDAATSAAK